MIRCLFLRVYRPQHIIPGTLLICTRYLVPGITGAKNRSYEYNHLRTRYHTYQKSKTAPGTRYYQACFQTFVLDREHSPPHKDIPGTAHHTYHTRYVDKKKNVDWVGYYTSTSCTFHMYVPVSTTGHVCIYATHIGKTAASQQLVNIKNPHNN